VGRRGVTIALRDGSGTRTYKFLSKETDRHKQMRIYFRRAGKRIRLRSEPGTPEFDEEYSAALHGHTRDTTKPRLMPPAGGSLAWLVSKYFESATFKRLAKDTCSQRRNILSRICEDHGSKPYAQMEDRHVRMIRDEKAETPGTARNRVNFLRYLFKWAIEEKLSRQNPAIGVRHFRTASEGFHTWTIEEVRQFEAFYPVGTKERLAMSLLFFLGVRRSDVVRLGRPMETDGGSRIRFTEMKGRDRKIKQHELMILPELRSVLDNSSLGHDTYLVTKFGKPWVKESFSNWFSEACERAGLPQCSAHGLRKAGATIAAENGATEMELMAIFGWSSPQQAAVYTRKANRVRLADRAMHLLIPEQAGDNSGQKINNFVAPQKAGATKTRKKAKASNG